MGMHTLTIGSENGDVGSTISYITIILPDNTQRHTSRTPFLVNDERFGEAFEHHCNNGKHYLRTITHLKGTDGLSIRFDNQTCVANTLARHPKGPGRHRRRQRVGQVVNGIRALFSRSSADAHGATSEDDREHATNFDDDDKEDPTCGHVIENTSSVRKWHHRCVETLRRNIEMSYTRQFGNQKRHLDTCSAYEDEYNDGNDDKRSMNCLHEDFGIAPMTRRVKHRRSFSSRFIEAQEEEMRKEVEGTIEDEHMAALLKIRWDKVWKKVKRVSLGDIWKYGPASASGDQHYASSSSYAPLGVVKSSTNETQDSMYYECLPDEGDMSSRPRPSHPGPSCLSSSRRLGEGSNMKASRNPSTEFHPPAFEFEYFDERDAGMSNPIDHSRQQYQPPSGSYDPTRHDGLMGNMVRGLDQYATKAFGQVNCHLFVCIPDPAPEEDSWAFDLEEATDTQANSTDAFPFPRPSDNWREVVRATMDIGWTMTGDDKIGRVPLSTVYNLLLDARTHGKTDFIFEAAGRDYQGRPRKIDQHNDENSGTSGSFNTIPKAYPQFTVDETFPFDPNLKSKAIDEVIERVLDSVQDLSFEALMWMQTYALWICKSMAVRMGQSLDHGTMKDLNWEYVSALDRMTLAIWLLLRLRRNRHASRVYSRVTMMRGDWDVPEVGQVEVTAAAAVAAEPSSAADGTTLSPSPSPLSPAPPAPLLPLSPPSSTDPQPATSSRSLEASRKSTHRLDPFIYAYNSRLSPATKLPKSVNYNIPVRYSSSSQSTSESTSKPLLHLSNNDADVRCSLGDSSCGCGRDSSDGPRLQKAFRTTIRPASAYIATATREDEDETSCQEDGDGGGETGNASEAKKVVTFDDNVVLVSNNQKVDDLTTEEIEFETFSTRRRRGNFIIEGKPSQKKIRRVSNPHTDPDPVATLASSSRTEYFADLSSQSTKAKSSSSGSAMAVTAMMTTTTAAATSRISLRESKSSLRETGKNVDTDTDTIALLRTDTDTSTISNTSVKSKDSTISQAEFEEQLFPSPAVMEVLNNLTFSPPQVQSIFVTCSSCPREFEISYLHQQENMTTYAKHVSQCSQSTGQGRFTRVKAALERGVSRVKKQSEQ